MSDFDFTSEPPPLPRARRKQTSRVTFTPVSTRRSWVHWAIAGGILGAIVLAAIVAAVLLLIRPGAPPSTGRGELQAKATGTPPMSRDEFRRKAVGTMANVAGSLGSPMMQSSQTRSEAIPGGVERIETVWERLNGAGGGRHRLIPQAVWIYGRRTVDAATKRTDAAASVVFENGVVVDVEFAP
jgi:hypothetical protein